MSLDKSVRPRDLADVLPMFRSVGFKVKLETHMGAPSAVLIFPDRSEALLFFSHGRDGYRDAVVLGWISAWLERRHVYPHPSYGLPSDPYGLAFRDVNGHDLRQGTLSLGYDKYEVTITAALKAVGKIDWRGDLADG